MEKPGIEKSDLASSCRAAASSVIHEAEVQKTKAQKPCVGVLYRQVSVSGEAVVRKNNVNSPDSLLKAHRERTEEREVVSQPKEDNAEMLRLDGVCMRPNKVVCRST